MSGVKIMTDPDANCSVFDVSDHLPLTSWRVKKISNKRKKKYNKSRRCSSLETLSKKGFCDDT